jgi:hypothetical protein
VISTRIEPNDIPRVQPRLERTIRKNLDKSIYILYYDVGIPSVANTREPAIPSYPSPVIPFTNVGVELTFSRVVTTRSA